MRQVVVNGLGHADDAHFVAALDGLLVDLVRGVLGIVAADVKEVADVVGLEHLEQPVHVFGGLLRLLLEIDLVAAGAQRGGGRVFQALDGPRLLVVDVNEFLVQDAQDAVGAAVDFLDALVPARFLNHAGQAGVDDGRRPARLRHQEISNQFCHNIPIASLSSRSLSAPDLWKPFQKRAQPCQ